MRSTKPPARAASCSIVCSQDPREHSDIRKILRSSCSSFVEHEIGKPDDRIWLGKPSIECPKFVRGSFDWGKDPGNRGREHLEHLGHRAAEAGFLPAPGVRRAFESPVVDGDAT